MTRRYLPVVSHPDCGVLSQWPEETNAIQVWVEWLLEGVSNSPHSRGVKVRQQSIWLFCLPDACFCVSACVCMRVCMYVCEGGRERQRKRARERAGVLYMRGKGLDRVKLGPTSHHPSRLLWLILSICQQQDGTIFWLLETGSEKSRTMYRIYREKLACPSDGQIPESIWTQGDGDSGEEWGMRCTPPPNTGSARWLGLRPRTTHQPPAQRHEPSIFVRWFSSFSP